jgi:selenocysteine lyase/cysteine desulfurase
LRLPERIQAYCAELTSGFLVEAQEMGFSVESPEYRGSHLFGLRMPEGLDLGALKAALAERNVSASLRGTALRLSPNVYNDKEDIEALAGVLRSSVR